MTLFREDPAERVLKRIAWLQRSPAVGLWKIPGAFE